MPSHTSHPRAQLAVKGELGRKAVAAQSAYMARAVEGLGVDRHFLGLKLLLQPGERLPALYADPLFQKSCHWKLSTSQITSEHYVGYGWGEVVPDGYGIAYMVKEDSLQFNLACLHEMRGSHLRAHFHEALAEMRVVFEASGSPLKAKL
jgi:carnitine O-acetyltransferase